MAGAFEGVRVVELSERVCGSYCAKLLADYGAEVIKVEHWEPAGLRVCDRDGVAERGIESNALLPGQVIAAAQGLSGNGRRELPLAGVRVLDWTWVMAGAVSTAMLADLGAEVISVSSGS